MKTSSENGDLKRGSKSGGQWTGGGHGVVRMRMSVHE